MAQSFETDVQTGNAAVSSASAAPSGFSWYELHTPDAAAEAAFYGAVLGWTTQNAGGANGNYTLVFVTGTPIGGLLEKPASASADAGGRALWLGYIGVHDVREFSKRVQQAGGVVHRPAEEIPGIGTFEVVADPQGAMFVLFQPAPGAQRPEQPKPCTQGMPAWHELGAVDAGPEFRFYADLFGWTKADAIDMGPMGVYTIFAVDSQPVGGMMTVPNHQRSCWMFYFHVEDIDSAIGRVKQNGGTVPHGPMVVPGGQQIAQCMDPQGAFFGMVAPGKQ